jgi:hypothetical protein
MNNEDTNDERKKEVAQQLLDIDLEVAREQIAQLYMALAQRNLAKSTSVAPYVYRDAWLYFN